MLRQHLFFVWPLPDALRNRKTIQHLEGGIVREILVGDGDLVRAGQTLISLEDTKAALREARQRGVHPFCITIDREADGYVRRMYGDVQFAVTLYANGSIRFDYGPGNHNLTPTAGVSDGTAAR